MSQSNQETKPRMTFAQAIIAGSVAGAAEVCSTGQILWSLKTRTQNKQPFTLNPWELARGMPLNALSMVPITALQVGCNQLIHQAYFQGAPLSNSQRMTSAFTAGVFAALVAGPTEMVMTHLKKGDRITEAPGKFVKKYGMRALYTGLMGTAARDGIFADAYLAITPLLKERFNPYFSSDFMVAVAANVTSGMLATVLSHPFDTIKTKQQLEDPSSHVGFKQIARKIHAEQGYPGFFAGGLWRGARVVTAVTIIGLVTNALEEQFSQYNSKTRP